MAGESVFFQFVGDSSDLEAAAARARGALAKTEAITKSTSARMAASFGRAGKKMSRAGSMLTRGVTLPIVAIGAAAIKTVAEYETSMNTFQAVSGATAGQMGKVATKAKALGADMQLPGTSAADAAEAMTELVKAGLSVNETMAASKGVLQLSAAAGVDNATAADIAASALNAFSMKGAEANRVADLLAGAANAAQGEITEMADAMKQSAAVYAAAGVPIEDLTTLISELAAKGIRGSDAGTSLKTMLMRLTAPTKKASDLMKDLGLRVFDARGKMLPMRTIIEKFAPVLAKMSEKQRAATLSTLFGADAVRAANIVLGGGVKAFDKMRGAVTKQGSAAATSAAKMKGVGGAIEGLKSTFETALLSLGEAFAPTIEKITRKLADLVGKFEKLSPATKQTIVKVAAAFAALGPALWILGKLTSGIGRVIGGVKKFGKGAATVYRGARTVYGGLGRLVGGFRNANVAQSAFSGKLGTLGGKIRHPITAIKDVGAAIGRMGKAMGTAAVNTAKGVASFAASMARAAASAVMAAARTVASWIAAAASAIASFVATAAAAVASAAATAAAWLVAAAPFILIGAIIAGLVIVVIKNWNTIKNFLIGVWNGIKAAASAVWNGIAKLFRTVLGIYKAIIVGAWNTIKRVVLTVWNAIRSAASTVWNGIKTVIGGAINAVKNVIGSVMGGIKKAWATAWGAIKGVATGIWDGILAAAKTGLNFIIGLLNKAVGAVNKLIGGFNRIPGVPDIPLVPEIPTLKRGGVVLQTGLAVVHEGERYSGVRAGAAATSTFAPPPRAAASVTIGRVVINIHDAKDPKQTAREVRTEFLKLVRRNGGSGIPA